MNESKIHNLRVCSFIRHLRLVAWFRSIKRAPKTYCGIVLLFTRLSQLREALCHIWCEKLSGHLKVCTAGFVAQGRRRKGGVLGNHLFNFLFVTMANTDPPEPKPDEEEETLLKKLFVFFNCHLFQFQV
jgi:hypothetical protein